MMRLDRSALVSALLLLASGTAGAAPRERDVWHAYVLDGKRYGYDHTVVTRLPDGNYRITHESRVLIDVLGVNREEIKDRREYVVTPGFRPVSIERQGEQGSGTTRVTGRIRGGAFELSATVAGVERSRTFEQQDEILCGPCLDDWLADRPPGFAEGTVMLLDEEACELQPARVKRLGSRDSNVSWSVHSGPEEGEQRIVLDADGLRREFSAAAGMTVLRRCSAEDAGKISYRKMDGRELLMFPLDKDISDPLRLESLTVELRWKEIGFDRFRLEDDRQRVVERSEEGGVYRALVRIEPPKPVTNPVRYPVEGAEFAPYLGESRYIKPRDARIVAVAREATQGKTDALEAVKGLSDWVSKNVEVAYIAETLSGPEVLACRKGKCSEYATLFASLARAVGIPTKIVLGDRMGGGQWGGHMWNEVYVGRWIPVDAGSNEVGTSLALLKFIDHETVEGTQPLRQALPASLEIKINDFRLQKSPLAGKFKTGIEGRVYTNAELGCRITALGEGWTIEEKSQPGAVLIRFKVPHKNDVQLHFVAFPLPAGIEPKKLIGMRQTQYKASLKDFEVIIDEEFAVNGLAGHRLQFTFTGPNGNARRSTEVLWRKAASGYLLTLNAMESVLDDELKNGFTALLESFEDLDQK